jgi:hypothetical protein
MILTVTRLGMHWAKGLSHQFAVLTTKNVKFFSHAFPHRAKGKNRDYTIAKK